ncbi:MAG TPA: sodium:solute symporter family protein, partial [Vicinamibacteria bacterium]
MIPAVIVFLYLAVVVYIGVFAFRKARGKEEVEDYFLANRSLGPFVFLMSLFGTNMTAFAILGSSGHAFANGIVTYGLMASSSALVIPLSLFLVGTRVWALGRKFG